MKINLLAWALPCAMLLACTTDVFLMKRDDTFNRYASAIRWGGFEEAQGFQDPAVRTKLDLAWLKTIHVSGYEIFYVKDDTSSKLVELTVKINYYNEQEGVDKSLTDRQVWIFNEEKNKWILESSLPAFR